VAVIAVLSVFLLAALITHYCEIGTKITSMVTEELPSEKLSAYSVINATEFYRTTGLTLQLPSFSNRPQTLMASLRLENTNSFEDYAQQICSQIEFNVMVGNC